MNNRMSWEEIPNMLAKRAKREIRQMGAVNEMMCIERKIMV